MCASSQPPSSMKTAMTSGSFGLVQDISRQVKYERDLENRDELARQSEEITDIGHFIYDEDEGNYLYVSEGFARIFGVSVEECMVTIKSYDDDLEDIYYEDRERIAEEYREYRAERRQLRAGVPHHAARRLAALGARA